MGVSGMNTYAKASPFCLQYQLKYKTFSSWVPFRC